MSAEFIPLYVTLVLGAVAAGGVAIWWAWRLWEDLHPEVDGYFLLPHEPPPELAPISAAAPRTVDDAAPAFLQQ